MISLHTIWQFKTTNFKIIVDAIPEDSSIEEQLQHSPFNLIEETIESVEEGALVNFIARARVFTIAGIELSSHYLGSCFYSTYDQFKNYNDYFPQITREAIAEARTTLQELQTISCNK